MARLLLFGCAFTKFFIVYLQSVYSEHDVFSSSNENQNQESTSRTLYDYYTRAIAYKDLKKSTCYLELMRTGTLNHNYDQITQEEATKTFIISTHPLSRQQILNLGGSRITEFCRGYLTYLLPNFLHSQHDLLNEVSAENIKSHKRKRSTQHYFRGRVRGQTQSQYLSFGNNQQPGRAEAESTYDGSKAIVVGSNGMGSAQSQTMPFGCEDCYGSGTQEQMLQLGGGAIQTPQFTEDGRKPDLYAPGISEISSYPDSGYRPGQILQGKPGQIQPTGEYQPAGYIPGQEGRPGTYIPGKPQTQPPSAGQPTISGHPQVPAGPGVYVPGETPGPTTFIPGQAHKPEVETRPTGSYIPGRPTTQETPYIPGQMQTPGSYIPGSVQVPAEYGIQRPGEGQQPGIYTQEQTYQPQRPQYTPGQPQGPQYVPGQTQGPQYTPGQSQGPQYAPGQPQGPQYAPGQAQLPQYAPGQQYIPGQQQGSQYTPGQAQGPQYVTGQPQAPQYAPGQLQGPQYAPAQIQGPEYTPGQPQKPLQVPGQELQYVPGQSQVPQYVPGQQQRPQYIPGQSQGPQYAPGQQGPQYVPGQSQGAQYVPGQQQGAQYVPGQSNGSQYVPGQPQILQYAPGSLQGVQYPTGHQPQYIPGQTQIPSSQIPSGYIPGQPQISKPPYVSAKPSETGQYVVDQQRGQFRGNISGDYQTNIGHSGRFSGIFSGNYGTDGSQVSKLAGTSGATYPFQPGTGYPAPGGTTYPSLPPSSPWTKPTSYPGQPSTGDGTLVTQPTSPGISHPLGPSASYPTGPGVSQPIGPGISQPISPGASQPIGPSILQPIGPGVTQPLGPGVSQPVGPGVSQPVGPGVTQPLGPGVSQPVSPGVSLPVGQGIMQPLSPGTYDRTQTGIGTGTSTGTSMGTTLGQNGYQSIPGTSSIRYPGTTGYPTGPTGTGQVTQYPVPGQNGMQPTGPSGITYPTGTGPPHPGQNGVVHYPSPSGPQPYPIYPPGQSTVPKTIPGRGPSIPGQTGVLYPSQPGIQGTQYPTQSYPGTQIGGQPTIAGQGVIGTQGPGLSEVSRPESIYEGKPTGADDADSQAETSVQQINNETQAVASAQGRYLGGLAQSQVSGSYHGTGSFSASAGTNDGKRGAQTQISGGKEGAISTAQGSGGMAQSQTQVQLVSETGDTTSSAQSTGFNHGTNTQVQASGKGGMADAQANGPGSTSSQAQIGFTPNNDNENDDQTVPFRGGGSASAQSGTHSGQTQAQIQGKFKYGIKYTGAAQAGSGNKESVLLARNQSKPSDTTGNFAAFKPIKIPSVNTNERIQPIDITTTEKNINQNRYKTENHVINDSHQRRDSVVMNEDGDDGGNGDDYNEDYSDYDGESTDKPSTKSRSIISQSSLNQRQHIVLDPLEDLDATVQQAYGDPILAEGTILQPGAAIPGSPGYQIPLGFRGRVASIAGNGRTTAIGYNSQAQSVTLKPGAGKIVYKKPVYAVASNTHLRNGGYGFGSGFTYQPIHQLKSGQQYPNFVSMSKSETGSQNIYTGKKTPSVYYTQSSSCGYFTNTCVFNKGSKICIPKPKTNPDGSPMIC